MPIKFTKAVRQNVWLLMGLIGGTGSGKTYTAMRLAKGICGDKDFFVIDTERGRALHYADQFNFMHAMLDPPFTPDNYLEAIIEAEKHRPPLILVDSASHEHAGEGGLLDWHESELDRMAKGDFKKRESCNMLAWVKPKMSHKRFVQRLLQVNAHIILCFRAEEKVDVTKDDKGKTVIVPKKSLSGKDGWIPVCEKTLPFEMTASFLLLADNPGVPHPIKLQEQHRPLFPTGKKIDENCGRLIAQWASGGDPGGVTKPKQDVSQTPHNPTPSPAPVTPGSQDQAQDSSPADTATNLQKQEIANSLKAARYDSKGMVRFIDVFNELMGASYLKSEDADFLSRNIDDIMIVIARLEKENIESAKFRDFINDLFAISKLDEQTVAELKDNLDSYIKSFQDSKEDLDGR